MVSSEKFIDRRSFSMKLVLPQIHRLSEYRKLSPLEAHIWFINPVSAIKLWSASNLWMLLSEEERSKNNKFHFADDRRDRLIARAFIRILLAHYADVDPRDWQFIRNKYGKPEILAPAATQLRFNLSYAHDLIVIGITKKIDCGIDVEHIRHIDNIQQLARRFFSSSEAAELEAWEEETACERFLEYWTLKEAYLKARGIGLSLQTNQFAFELKGNGKILFSADATLTEDPTAWQFVQFRPIATHIVSLALRRPPNKDIEVIQRWLVK
jgi:4'-phosphopantetheinyl transferase